MNSDHAHRSDKHLKYVILFYYDGKKAYIVILTHAHQDCCVSLPVSDFLFQSSLSNQTV